VCGACKSDHGRRWTSTRLTLLAFIGVLSVFSIAGVIIRIGSFGDTSADPCLKAASAAVRFQAAVTRDLGKPALLRSDTARFSSEIRSLAATGCAGTQRFLLSGEQTIGELCPGCAAELRRLRAPSR
jgi:hypothetical protein